MKHMESTNNEMLTGKAASIDEYILNHPEEIRLRLQQLRETIQVAAPEAQEAISYGMPAFRYNGILCYFAGYKNHIGFYPTGSGIKAFEQVLSGFKWSKGAVQFAHTKALPLELVSEMVKYRVAENQAKGLKNKK
jgi:uncharacterized protein YdhG (YjbR/CyaY superfamily)